MCHKRALYPHIGPQDRKECSRQCWSHTSGIQETMCKQIRFIEPTMCLLGASHCRLREKLSIRTTFSENSSSRNPGEHIPLHFTPSKLLMSQEINILCQGRRVTPVLTISGFFPCFTCSPPRAKAVCSQFEIAEEIFRKTKTQRD